MLEPCKADHERLQSQGIADSVVFMDAARRASVAEFQIMSTDQA